IPRSLRRWISSFRSDYRFTLDKSGRRGPLQIIRLPLDAPAAVVSLAVSRVDRPRAGPIDSEFGAAGRRTAADQDRCRSIPESGSEPNCDSYRLAAAGRAGRRTHPSVAAVSRGAGGSLRLRVRPDVHHAVHRPKSDVRPAPAADDPSAAARYRLL